MKPLRQRKERALRNEQNAVTYNVFGYSEKLCRGVVEMSHGFIVCELFGCEESELHSSYGILEVSGDC
jgi:hypothetical protein